MRNSELPAIVAIDLGAESCRVSTLEWIGETPRVQLVHRFPNAPVSLGHSLVWDLDRILLELRAGVTRCAEQVSSKIASIGVDGWAVDYVRLDSHGSPLHAPFCYRDPRTEVIAIQLQRRCSNVDLFALSGVQPQRINTLFQLLADEASGLSPSTPWVTLPEYVLMTLGGQRVAEYTNATHTGLVDPKRRTWSRELFEISGLDSSAPPTMVDTGTDIGMLSATFSDMAALRGTRLIATACHDTASAVAGIPLGGDGWAYISSGTWSLVGTLLDESIITTDAQVAGFTNLGAAGNRICFHRNVNGMWMLRQVIQQLSSPGGTWSMAELLAACETLDPPEHLLDVDDPALLLPHNMAEHINAQRRARGASPIDETSRSVPAFASLIFHSLAARYAEVLSDLQRIAGKRMKRLAIVGGGSQNKLLNQLTQQATGLEVVCGVAESSTIGNFAVQLATLEGHQNSRERIAHWANVLTAPDEC